MAYLGSIAILFALACLNAGNFNDLSFHAVLWVGFAGVALWLFALSLRMDAREPHP